MTRGPKPTPTPIRKLDGNPQKRPLNEQEPDFEVAAETEGPPWDLDVHGMELWNRLYAKLVAARVMTVADVMLFAAACEQWSVYRRATMRGRRSLTQRTKAGGLGTAPHTRIAKAALRDVYDLLREWGVGASSRSRISVPLAGEDKDEFEEMLKRKKA